MTLLNYIFHHYLGCLILILCFLLLALVMIYIKERRTKPLSPEGPTLEAPAPLKRAAKLEATEIRDLTPDSSAEEEEVSAEEVLHTATHPEEKI